MPVRRSDIFSFVLLNVRMLLSGVTSDTKSQYDFKNFEKQLCQSADQTYSLIIFIEQKFDRFVFVILPTANEVCEGYVFTGIFLSTGGGVMCGAGGWSCNTSVSVSVLYLFHQKSYD